jgi:hypothetical protein
MALSCARMRFASACSHTLAVPNRRKSDGDAAKADGAGTEEKAEEAGGGEETEGATALTSAPPPAFALSARVDACDASEMESSDGRFSCGEERASVSALAAATAAAAALGPPSLLLLIRLTAPDEETTAIDEDDEECTGEDAVELLMENTALVLGKLEGADARVLESMDDVNGVGANHCDGVTREEKNEPTADVDGGGGGGAGTDCGAAWTGAERLAGELVMVGASKVDLVDAAAGSGIKGCSAR